jgi:hypothetical protein
MIRRCFTSILLFISFIISSGLAQDDYQKWLSKENEKYSKFLSEDDKKFADFLRKEWTQVGLSLPQKPFEKPKTPNPVFSKPPEVKVEDKEIEKEIPPSISPKGKVTPPNDTKTRTQPEVSTTQIKFIEPTSVPGLDLLKNNLSNDINYYGTDFKYYYNDDLKVYLSTKLSKDAIADYWIEMNSKNYKDCIAQAKYYKDKYKINDWGYLSVLYDYSKVIYPNNPNERYMFCWFMLIKSGYLARVGFMDDRIGLLIGSKHNLFGKLFYSQKDIDYRFFCVVLDDKETEWSGNIKIYKEDFPTAINPFEFNLTASPLLPEVVGTRQINFSFGDAKYNIELKYNKNVIDFYKNYPFSDFSIYFSSPPSSLAGSSLANSLKPLIKNKNEFEAVNFLLRFAQSATEYQTDQEQFDREKPLFVEESLCYAYSDCEDRSVFFSYLVSELLGLDVIGIDYPNHIATAVNFKSEVKGTYFTHNDKKYVICDPTYLDADVGMLMPGYEDQESNIIEIKGN